MKICYLISEDYLNLTLNSISYIKKFNSANTKLEFIIFHFGDLDHIKISGVTKKKIPRLDYPFFLHRGLMFDEFDEKVIFMDSDTICMTNISKLYNIDLDSNLLGAAQHNWLTTHKEAFKIYKPTELLEKSIICDDFPFFNAGVMLVNCSLWKELNVTKKVLNFYEKYKGEWYDWNDEIALNCLFGRARCKFIDSRWNYNEDTFGKPFIKHYYGHKKNLLQL